MLIIDVSICIRRYAELLKQIDLVREESEKEEKLMSNMVKAQVVRENDAVNKIREAQRMTALEEHKVRSCSSCCAQIIFQLFSVRISKKC